MGYILLEGEVEFGGMMTAPDQRAIELAGGKKARISIIPAAAARMITMSGPGHRYYPQNEVGKHRRMRGKH